ncbi:MAG: C40 family peptidase [Acidobacteriota bacterium]|jgi:cell wall-associated NlpC family hydrolase|nr:C40 family peptidase [Acidobacteriota bacterium]
MKTHHFIVITAAILAALLVSAPVFAEQQIYVVRKGDNLYRISKSFNTTPESLKEINGLNSDRLSIGQILKITASLPVESAKEVAVPKIQPSAETAVKKTNQEQPQIQQTQQIENDQQARKETQTYTVRKGDTLLGIARSFNISVNSLSGANKIKNSNTLKIGQVLTIPVRNNAVAETQIAKIETAAPAKTQVAKVETAAVVSAKKQPVATAAAVEANQAASRPVVNVEELTTRDRLVEAGFNMLGVRYRFGGTSEKTGFDCSALVKNLFEKVGFTLPRSSREQYKQGEKVAKEDLQKGDLVFFSSSGKTPTHVGIYIGDNQFLHAASRAKKVIISDLGKTWYDLRYLGARRIMDLWWEDARGPLNDAPSKELTMPIPPGGAPDEKLVASAVPQEGQ